MFVTPAARHCIRGDAVECGAIDARQHAEYTVFAARCISHRSRSEVLAMVAKKRQPLSDSAKVKKSRAPVAPVAPIEPPPRPVTPGGWYGHNELKTITARMTAAELVRVDAVAVAIAKGPHGFSYGPPNRSTAFRTLLEAGLNALEPRYGIKPAKVTK